MATGKDVAVSLGCSKKEPIQSLYIILILFFFGYLILNNETDVK